MKETKLDIFSAHERKIKIVAQRTSGWFQKPRDQKKRGALRTRMES